MDVIEVKKQAIGSIKWTVIGELASRSIQPLITLILARLLTPSDFGLVGVAMIAMGFAQIFQDFGLAKTLIQRETNIEKTANIIFWTNIVLSSLIYVILFFAAPAISVFFNEPRIINVLRLLSLQLIISSFISVHQALFQRNFQFKKLFLIRFFSATIPGVFSIPLALHGYGVWALVYGAIAGSICQLALYWWVSGWRPQFNYDVHFARQLLRFSSWIVLEVLIAWLLMWGDSLILGRYLGIKELGVYRCGVSFLLLIFNVFFNPILPVAYSAFSKLQFNQQELNRSFLKAIGMISAITLPLGVGLALFAEPISLLFGEKWHGIEVVIAFLGIKDGITSISALNPEVLRASGKPDVYPKIWAILAMFFIPTYFLAAPYGLKMFCLARLCVSMLGLIIQIIITMKVLRIPIKAYLQNVQSSVKISFLFGISCIPLIVFSYFFPFHKIWQVFPLIIFLILLYLTIFRLFAKNALYDIVGMIKKVI